MHTRSAHSACGEEAIQSLLERTNRMFNRTLVRIHRFLGGLSQTKVLPLLTHSTRIGLHSRRADNMHIFFFVLLFVRRRIGGRIGETSKSLARSVACFSRFRLQK